VATDETPTEEHATTEADEPDPPGDDEAAAEPQPAGDAAGDGEATEPDSEKVEVDGEKAEVDASTAKEDE